MKNMDRIKKVKKKLKELLNRSENLSPYAIDEEIASAIVDLDGIEYKIVDKTWSIKHEGKLNKDNIIFKEEYIALAKILKEEDDKILKNKK